jgi:site-specific DNA-cytosine methylase
MTASGRLKAVDLCCGAGGWAFAARGLPIDFVAVADIERDCLETWRTNHAVHHPKCSLIECDLSAGTQSVLESIGGQSIDLVLGGIPCEQISIMRQVEASASVMENWHELVDQCLRFVDLVSAPFWCLEDVIQIEKLLPLPLFHGREIPIWRVDASDFGPQSRVRTFVGDFPRPEPRHMAERTVGQCLRAGPHLTISRNEDYERLEYPGRQITLLSGENTCRVLNKNKPSPTVLGGGPHRGQRQRRNWMVEDELGRIRILSLQEFARLQGFPDDTLFACGACRAQEMVGQAIPIYVGRAILESIVDLARSAVEPLSVGQKSVARRAGS